MHGFDNRAEGTRMHVLDIVVTSLQFSPDGTKVIGGVQFTVTDDATGSKTINVGCETPVSARIQPDALLIGDAIRQLRRTPEIRSGSAYLTFAKGLKPLNKSEAA